MPNFRQVLYFLRYGLFPNPSYNAVIYLNLNDPALPHFAPAWKRLSFHFAGVMSGGDEGDWLILNHPLQQAFDYERLALADAWSRPLLAAIEAEAPVLQPFITL